MSQQSLITFWLAEIGPGRCNRIPLEPKIRKDTGKHRAFKVGMCINCHEQTEVVCKGLCRQCYDYARKKARFITLESLR